MNRKIGKTEEASIYVMCFLKDFNINCESNLIGRFSELLVFALFCYCSLGGSFTMKCYFPIGVQNLEGIVTGSYITAARTPALHKVNPGSVPSTL